jgi:hypothetical protein
MKITQAVREYAASQGHKEEEAFTHGMEREIARVYGEERGSLREGLRMLGATP